MQLQYNNKSSEKQPCSMGQCFDGYTCVYLFGLTTYQLCVLGLSYVFIVENSKNIENIKE